MTDQSEFLTPRLRLRPFSAEDLPHLLDYGLQDYFWRYLPLDPQTPESVKSFLDERLEDDWGNGRYQCAVELIEAGHLIGTIRLEIQNSQHRNGDLGYGLNRAFSGNGYMTEAVTRMLRVGFSEFALHRIWATADLENTASWRVLERAGMQREGLLRHEKLIRGVWRDSYLYSILESDI